MAQNMFDAGDVVAINGHKEYIVERYTGPGIVAIVDLERQYYEEWLQLVRPAKWRVGDLLRHKADAKACFEVAKIEDDLAVCADDYLCAIAPQCSAYRLMSRPGVTRYSPNGAWTCDEADGAHGVLTAMVQQQAVCPECKGNGSYVYIGLFGDRHNCGLCGGGGA